MRVASKKVGLLFRGDRKLRDTLVLEKSRLSKIAASLRLEGLIVEGVVFDESFIEEVRSQLLKLDGVLVWVDPVTDAGDRTALDALLRDVADHGVMVSAHPQTILKMGTKDVLFQTRDMPFGSDVRRYANLQELETGLRASLGSGQPRVLKQYRGNGGHGVYKVELEEPNSGTMRDAGEPGPDTPLRVRPARRGSQERIMAFAEFARYCGAYFDNGGKMIDQAWQARLTDGMVRCYLVKDKVAGFGEQLVNALYPASPESPDELPAPGPRLYYPPSRSDFQALKSSLENEWLAQIQHLLDVSTDALPLLWDADFLYGEKTVNGEDTFVLCEINVSAVLPFPDEALVPLAAETRKVLESRRA